MIVLTRKGLVSGKNVAVTMPGGIVSINIEKPDAEPEKNDLTEPTTMVAEGEIIDEDLEVST